MNKRVLSKIPVANASDDACTFARRVSEAIDYICTVNIENVDKKEISVLNFYKTGNIVKGNLTPIFRTFISHDDYITQRLCLSKPKWSSASFTYMQNDRGFHLWETKWNSKEDITHRDCVVFATEDEKHIVEDFFKEYAQKDDFSVWNRVVKFQYGVMKRRLEAKHKKETDVIDAVMNTLQPIPQGFYNWLWNTAFSFSKYLVYKSKGGNGAECQCTHCGNIFIADRKKLHLKNNTEGICPKCESKVTFKALGRMPLQFSDCRWAVYVEKMQDGFVYRYFYATKTYTKGLNVVKTKNDSRELFRSFHSYGETHTAQRYEWGDYKQSGIIRWCPDSGRGYHYNSLLYPDNLPGEWEHTPMRYSALEVLSRNNPTTPFEYEEAIYAYKNFPRLEWFIKMKLNKLANVIINSEGGRFGYMTGKLNREGKTIYDILSLDKERVRMLQQIDGNSDELRLLQGAKAIKLRLSVEQLKSFYEMFGCNIELLKELNSVSFHKLVKYLKRESEKYPKTPESPCDCRYLIAQAVNSDTQRIQHTAHDWLEYLGWCMELRYDISDRFYYMPTNFKAVHDRTAEEYQALKDREKAKEQERYNKIIEKMKADKDSIPVFHMHDNGLFIRLPENSLELKFEGESLHHCVGTYVEKVAKGETVILFVRKESEPNEPYYTLEWKGKLVQCRGSHNCGMTDEVKRFVGKFEKKMVEYEESLVKVAEVS